MLNKNNGVYNFQLKIIIFFLCISLLNFEDCYKFCKTCYEYSFSFFDMNCIECKYSNYSILNNTTNCVLNSHYNDYYIKKNDDNITVLYPCSELDNSCYECDPGLETTGICLSCIPGYVYNESTHVCIKIAYIYKK